MKQAAIIWCVALVVAILGVFYVNWCIDSARSGFVREEAVDASSFPASMYYDEATGEVVGGDVTLTVSDARIVGVQDLQGEDNMGYRLQPAQIRSLDYRVPTIIQQ